MECIVVLKPQDVLVALKLVSIGSRDWSYAALAVELSLSPSQLHAAIQRLFSCRLAVQPDKQILVNRRNLLEFLTHGIQYVFVPERGELTRGMPTAHAAAPLAEHFIESDEPPPVWPDPLGEIRGQSFSPLHRAVSDAARADAQLYELLALVDAIRGGRVRERQLASAFLKERLASHA